MVRWIRRFFSLCVRVGRTFVATLECEIRVMRRDPLGVSRVVYASPPARSTDSRPRVRVALTWGEDPPDGLVRVLARLEAWKREGGGLRHAPVEPIVLGERVVLDEPVVALEAQGTRGGR